MSLTVFSLFQIDKSHLQRTQRALSSRTQSVRQVNISQINMKLLISSLFLVGAASAFSINQVEPKVVKVKEGGSFRVLCTTSTWYEVRQTTLLEILRKLFVVTTARPTIQSNNDLFCESKKLSYHPQSI